MGVLVNRIKDENSLEFLSGQLSDTGAWNHRVEWHAPFNIAPDKQEFQDKYLADAAIKGMRRYLRNAESAFATGVDKGERSDRRSF